MAIDPGVADQACELTFPFLDLPPELRNAIYKTILPFEFDIGLAGKLQISPLVYARRQIQGEGLSIILIPSPSYDQWPLRELLSLDRWLGRPGVVEDNAYGGYIDDQAATL